MQRNTLDLLTCQPLNTALILAQDYFLHVENYTGSISKPKLQEIIDEFNKKLKDKTISDPTKEGLKIVEDFRKLISPELKRVESKEPEIKKVGKI